EDPPASEARRGPTFHCPSACPPGSLRLVLRLTAPGRERPRPRALRLVGPQRSGLAWPCACGPPHTPGGWGSLAVLRQRLPSAPRCGPCAASLAAAASCTPARVCTRLSLVLAVASCAPVSAAP